LGVHNLCRGYPIHECQHLHLHLGFSISSNKRGASATLVEWTWSEREVPVNHDDFIGNENAKPVVSSWLRFLPIPFCLQFQRSYNNVKKDKKKRKIEMRRMGVFFESNMESCYLSLHCFIISSKKNFKQYCQVGVRDVIYT
jgi:hypothetical protein